MSIFLQKKRVLTRKRTKRRINSLTGILWLIVCVVRITITKSKLYRCHGYLLVQNAERRPDIKCRLSTKCRLQTADSRVGTKCRLDTISSIHTVSSLCVRVGWCDVCADFTNLIKIDADVNEMSLLTI